MRRLRRRARRAAGDDAATVRRRLAVYADRTEPLIAYYRNGDTPAHFIDGEGPVDEVQERIVRSLEGGETEAAGDGDR